MDKNGIANHVDQAADTAKGQIAKATDTFTQLAECANSAAGTIRGTAMQVGKAATKAYQQGAQAADRLSRNTVEQPLTALLIAGAVGYVIARLIHAR